MPDAILAKAAKANGTAAYAAEHVKKAANKTKNVTKPHNVKYVSNSSHANATAALEKLEAMRKANETAKKEKEKA